MLQVGFVRKVDMLPFVPVFVPNLVQVAPFVLAFAILCANPLRKHAGWFYALWTLVVVAATWYDPVISLMGEAAPAAAFAMESQMSALPSTMPALYAIVQLLT